MENFSTKKQNDYLSENYVKNTSKTGQNSSIPMNGLIIKYSKLFNKNVKFINFKA